MRVLIVGCGYIGVALGAELVRLGHQVIGMRRSSTSDSALTTAGIQPFRGDITKDGDLARLPESFDWVINTVSSGRGGLEEYRASYLKGAEHLLRWMEAQWPKKFVYTSSTGVYGQDDGSWVTETSRTDPASSTAQVLLETERLMFEAFETRKLPIVILRLAGIYGPERTYFLRQFLSGKVKLAGQGGRIMNMVHRDDVVGAIIAALDHGRAGEVYNVTDDEPVSQLQFYRWLADALDRPMPPFATEGDDDERKRGLTSKKVCNQKLRTELRYRLRFPTFREGYTAEIKRLEGQGGTPR